MQLMCTICTILNVWNIILCERIISMNEIQGITAKIVNLVNGGIGQKEFQEYINGLQYNIPAQITLEDAKNVAESIYGKLSGRKDKLLQFQQELQESYTDITHVGGAFQQCKNVYLGEKSFLHNTKINRNEWCIVGKTLSSDESIEFLPSYMLDRFKNVVNSEREAIKRVIYGTEQGLLTTYPASRLCPGSSCSDRNYDPRFESWYVTTASPKPKDVVLIVDKSGSMSSDIAQISGVSRMDIAKEAAITVLQTLSANDRVSVIGFSDDVDIPSGQPDTSTCYASRLVKATPHNVDYLTAFIENIYADGETYYHMGLQKAFELFDSTGAEEFDQRTRDRVILMLTDGDPTDSTEDIYQAIRTGNAQIGNKVVILTYGIGDLSVGGENTLRNISKQEFYDAEKGEVRQGKFENVNAFENLRLAMGSYYDFFKENDQVNAVQFTVPNLDGFETGLQIQMCVQINVQHSLKGVACIDQPVEDIVGEIASYQVGDQSYGFLIDEQARVISHPLRPNPLDLLSNVGYVYLSTLEFGHEIEDLISRMQRRENGSLEVSSRRVKARGNIDSEGITKLSNVRSTYYFYPIKDFKFIVCIVSTMDTSRATISNENWNGPGLRYPPFLYHKHHLSQPSESCRAATRIAMKESGSFKLAARAFSNGLEYLVKEENQNDFNNYKQYFDGNDISNSRNEPFFKESVREVAAALFQLNHIYGSRTEFQDNIIWRYFGTGVGVHFTYPGIELPALYDPALRTWYHRQMAYKDKIVLTTPYEDAFGAGLVMSLTTTVFHKSISSTDEPSALGVIGMDLSLIYSFNLITGDVTSCQNHTCFVVDQAGFIVAHKQWINGGHEHNVEGIHMTYYEKNIAARLEEDNKWSQESCINMAEVRKQIFGKISVQGMYDAGWFEIHEIEETNLFLVVKKGKEVRGDCKCRTPRDATLEVASCLSPYDCTCPCYEHTDRYSFCKGLYHLGSDFPPPCSPPATSVDFGAIAIKDLEKLDRLNLDYCYDYKCPEKYGEMHCRGTLSCKWCNPENYDVCNKKMAHGCMGEEMTCSDNQTPYSANDCMPNSSVTSFPLTVIKPKEPFPAWAIAIIVIVVILIIVITIFGIILIKFLRRAREGTTSDNDPYVDINTLRPPQQMPGKGTTSEEMSLSALGPPPPMAHNWPGNCYLPPGGHGHGHIISDSYITSPGSYQVQRSPTAMSTDTGVFPDVTCEALLGEASSVSESSNNPPFSYMAPPQMDQQLHPSPILQPGQHLRQMSAPALPGEQRTEYQEQVHNSPMESAQEHPKQQQPQCEHEVAEAAKYPVSRTCTKPPGEADDTCSSQVNLNIIQGPVDYIILDQACENGAAGETPGFDNQCYELNV